jgi:hypothetical protein
MPDFEYTVDGIPQRTEQHELTPRTIIANAGLNPNERYLIEIRGREQITLKDKMDVPIRIHEHAKFITASIGPTPVS